MTERKPAGVNWESFIDKQIRAAQERGEFDNLPGAGKPLDDLDLPYDQVWTKRQLRSGELGAESLPTPLRLRKEIERLPQAVRTLRDEQRVRDTVAELNARIHDWLLVPIGPSVAHHRGRRGARGAPVARRKRVG